MLRSFAATSVRASSAESFAPVLSLGFSWGPVRTATKKAGGSSKNGRDSNAQRLGVKLFGGQLAWPGCVIIRQRGTRFHPEADGSVGMGKDHTIYASTLGRVAFRWDPVKRRQVVFVARLGAPETVDAVTAAL